MTDAMVIGNVKRHVLGHDLNFTLHRDKSVFIMTLEGVDDRCIIPIDVFEIPADLNLVDRLRTDVFTTGSLFSLSNAVLSFIDADNVPLCNIKICRAKGDNRPSIWLQLDGVDSKCELTVNRRYINQKVKKNGKIYSTLVTWT